MAGLMEYLHYTIRFLQFFVTNLYGLPCYVTWMILASPLRVLAPTIFWKIESMLFTVVQGFIITWLRGYQVFECGDDINVIEDEETLVLVNHQSTADTPLVMLANYTKGTVTGKTTWIMWYIFKYTNFGIMSMLREDFFIHSGKQSRESETDRLKKYMLNSFVDHGRKWVVVFPEGGFLHKRREASQAFARKNDYPMLTHVTLPRVGAVQAILSTIGEPYEPLTANEGDSVDGGTSNGSAHQQLADPQKPMKWVIDMTIAYKDCKPLDMLGMCIGYCPKNLISLHYKAYRVQDIPRDTEGLTNWLYNRYVEKDEMLESFYKNGNKFPDKVLNERRVLPSIAPTYLRFDLLRNLLVHAFCLCSDYLHYVFIYKPIYVAICGFFSLFI